MCVYGNVRTTIDIPDELYRELKVTAAKTGRTLKDVAIERMRQAPEATEASGLEPWWRKAFGGLAHMHEENLAIQAFIDEEFSKINPEEWK